MYQRLIKKILNKDVEDAYPTEAPKLDKTKPLADQLVNSSAANAAINMGSSAGTVGSAGKKAIQVINKEQQLADALLETSKVIPAKLSKAEKIIQNVKQSKDPAIALRAETAMDVLNNTEKQTLSYGKGGKRTDLPSVEELMKVIAEKKASGDVAAIQRLEKKWKQIKLDRK